MLLNTYNFSFNKNNLNILNSKNFNESKKENEIKNNKESLLSIFCKNCANEIPIDLIEKHSNICTKIKDEKTNKKNIFFEINNNLEKLKNNILKYFNNEIKLTKSIKEELKFFGKKLINLINDCLNLNKIDLENIKNLNIILNKISILKDLKFSFQSTILIERAFVLINEKCSIINKLYHKNNNNFNKTLNLENLNNKFEFYKLVEKIKLEKFSFSHLSQKIQPKILYNEAIKNKIPKEKWFIFIYKKLKNPLDKKILSYSKNRLLTN